MPEPDERSALFAFLTASVLAGGNGVAIRFSNRELDPLWGAGLRFTLAAALLIAIAAAMRISMPRGRALLGAVLFGVLDVAVAFGLAYYALIELHAGFGQLLLATVPLMTLALAWMQGQERLRLAAIAGGAIALAGVTVMSSAPLRGSLPLLSILAALGSALALAQATVLVRHLPPIHPVAINAIAMTAGAALLLLAALVAGDEFVLPKLQDTWIALGYVVVVGSVLVFVLYLYVLARWEASRTAYLFVVVPVVTVALSAWLDDEPVGLGLLAGGLLVLVGVYVGALRPTRTEI